MADYREKIAKYEMIYDHHTHTVYSHGKGTIEENVKRAWEKGLESIAITDHGPGHLTYGIRVSEIGKMKEDIAQAKRKYPEIDVLLGVEANTLRKAPFIDTPPEDRKKYGYDILLAGYHYGVLHGGVISNWLYKHVGKGKGIDDNVGLKSTSIMLKNTEMILNCLYENEKQSNHIDILTHPGDKGPFDLVAIAKACSQVGTLMEINGKHPHLSIEELKLVSAFDVKFVISSDAHEVKWIGVFEPQLERALRAGIDPERIVNIRLK